MRWRSIWILTLAVVIWHGQCMADDFAPVFPERGEVVSPYTPELVKQSFVERGMHRIEGIWKMTNGTLVAIERVDDRSNRGLEAIALYRVAVLEASQRSVRPGTIIGYIAPGADNDVYEGRFYTDYSHRGLPSSPKKMTIRLDAADNRLTLHPEKPGWRVSLRHSLPWLFLLTVRYNMDGSKKGSYGGIRIYPAPALPLEPIYL